MLPFPSSATFARYRFSTQLKVFTGIAIVAVGGTSLFLLAVGKYDANFFLAAGFCCLLLVAVHVQQYGYRIGWDDTSLYMRRWGFLNGLNVRPEVIRIGWAEVSSVKSKMLGIFGRGGDFLPFEVIEVKSRRPDVRRIPIYPFAMNAEDFEELATYMTAIGKLHYE